MLLQGTVVSYNPSTKIKKQAGGQYDAWELVYRSTENEVKTIAKPVQGLRFNAALKNSLEQLTQGDEFTALLEKNANGFYDVKSIEKGIKDMVEAPAASTGRAEASAPVRGGKVTGSNYETAEERAKRQVVITRLGTLNTAVQMAAGVVEQLTPEAVIAVAKELEKHAMKDLEKAASKYMEVSPKVE